MLFGSRLPSLLQTEAAECGLASLTMIANYYGHQVDLNALRHRFALSLKGATLADLIAMADLLDLSSRPLRAELEHLPDLKVPCILHWDLNHYVVLREVRRGIFVIHDPARGVLKLPEKEVSRHFSGIVLEVEPSANFKPIREIHVPRMRDLWTSIVGLRRSLGQIVLLSLIAQVIFLTLPLFLQTVVDQIAPTGDRQFLGALAAGFFLLQLLSSATEALRGYVVLALAQRLNMQMIGNLFRHLMRLPTSFFEKRFVGDILSRVGSTRQIQEVMTQGAASTMIDGAVSIISAIALCLIRLPLALIVIGGLAIHLLAIIVFYSLRRRKEEELAVARAEEQSHLIESIRANKAVKLFGKEAEREVSWRNLYTKVANASMEVGSIDVGLKFSQSLVFGLSLVAVIYFGALQMLAGTISLGTLFAFLLFRNHLTDRASALFERGMQFKLLQVHLLRLSDIIQSQPELETAGGLAPERPFLGRLELASISFRYARNEPLVLDHLDVDIAAGEFIAIVGGSGNGKSTLLKLALGLYEPSAGTVRVDGLALNSFGMRRWRSLIGVVQQDDELLAGTIAENISFFAPDVDFGRVEECAREALIHDEIVSMPMGYLSLVGDMGSTLSGGQRQRMLLARALYHRPGMLFLDEGTANLDPETEKNIADVIEKLDLTRIIIAHRPELVRRADRVFELKNKKLWLVNAREYFSGEGAARVDLNQS